MGTNYQGKPLKERKLMRHIIKTLLLLFLTVFTTSLYGADASVSHQIRLNSPQTQVLKALSDNRIELLETTGIRVRKLRDNTFKAWTGRHVFIITEQVQKGEKSTKIIWRSTRNSPNYYSSVIECVNEGKTTLLRGNVTISVGNLRLGSNILRSAILDGVDSIYRELKDLLNADNRRKS